MKFYFYFSFVVSVLAVFFGVWALSEAGKPSYAWRSMGGAFGQALHYVYVGAILVVILLNGLIVSWLAMRSGVGEMARVSLALHILPIVVGVLMLIARGVIEHQSDLSLQMRIAVESGSVEKARALLGQGQSPDQEDNHGKRLLQVAAHNGDVAMMRVLVEAGAEDVGAALWHAARSGRAEAVEYLLALGVDANYGWRDRAALLSATSLEAAQALVEAGADIQAVNEFDQETVLMQAVRNGRREIVAYLLAQGVDIQARDHKNRNALHYASYTDSAVITALLDKGIDCRLKSRKGNLALHDVVTSTPRDAGREEEADVNPWTGLERLIACTGDVDVTTRKGETPLMLRARIGFDAPLYDALLKAGARIDARNEAGVTALMMAFERGPGGHETLMYLLAHGASVEPTDNEGNTALHRVGASGVRLEAVEALLEAGADPNQRNHAGLTPFLRLMHEEDLRLGPSRSWLDAMLEHGADPGMTDAEGNTALMAAAGNKRSVSDEVLGTLIDAGVSGANDKTNARGRTAMMIAMGEGRTEAVMRLLDAGARAGGVDEAGDNMFHYLARYDRLSEVERRSIVERLLASGVSLSVRNKAGQTPYDVALENNLDEAHRVMFGTAELSAAQP